MGGESELALAPDRGIHLVAHTSTLILSPHVLEARCHLPKGLLTLSTTLRENGGLHHANVPPVAVMTAPKNRPRSYRQRGRVQNCKATWFLDRNHGGIVGDNSGLRSTVDSGIIESLGAVTRVDVTESLLDIAITMKWVDVTVNWLDTSTCAGRRVLGLSWCRLPVPRVLLFLTLLQPKGRTAPLPWSSPLP